VGLGRIATRTTQLLAIEGRSYEKLESRFAPSSRNKIRKGRRLALATSSGTDSQLIGDFWNLYRLSSARWGYREAKYSEAFFAAFAGCGSATFRLAYAEERPVAGILVFSLGSQDFYWASAYDRSLARYSAVNVLIAEAIQAAAQRGAAFFNFGPSERLEGVKAFKLSFGAREWSYGVYCAANPFIRAALRQAYRRAH
jgi:lipid II:glycine glycyltransferase (peptidoglycan interpeptide bridge formation enzyme)